MVAIGTRGVGVGVGVEVAIDGDTRERDWRNGRDDGGVQG